MTDTAVHDVVVVGARCAGATTAMLLAREGLDVLLLDRATFPSEIPHGHFIHRGGPQRLKRWGLLDAVLATGAPAVTRSTIDLGDFPLTATGLVADGAPMGVGPRRGKLDQVFVDAAVAAGATFHDGVSVDGLDFEHARVTGVRGRDTRSGRPLRAAARVVVGADGRNSRVARWAQAPMTLSLPTVACWYFSYWSGVPSDELGVRVRDRRAIFTHPTSDGLTAAFVGFPAEELPVVRRDIPAAFGAALDRFPELAERFRAGHREERFYGATQMPNFLRRPQGPGWALVGDAGCNKDPFLALGVCDALRDAESLAGALTDGFGGAESLDDALAGYERRRDAATLEDFRANVAAARFELPPELLRVRAAVRGDQAATNALFAAREGWPADWATASAPELAPA